MKVLKGIIPVVLVLSVIGYVLYLQFFGIDAQYKTGTDTLIENMEKGEMTYKNIIPDSTGGYFTYEFDGSTLQRIHDGEVFESNTVGSVEYIEDYETIHGFVESASFITELNKDIEIIDSLDIEVLGTTEEDVSGEWYKVSYKGGCQSGSCQRRGIASDEVTTIYLKVDGTGYVSSGGHAIFFK